MTLVLTADQGANKKNIPNSCHENEPNSSNDLEQYQVRLGSVIRYITYKGGDNTSGHTILQEVDISEIKTSELVLLSSANHT